MDDVKNKIGVIILGVILLIFIFGGYFLKNYMVNGMGDTTKDNTNKIIEDIRINKEKAYKILQTIGVKKELLEEVYKKLINQDVYYDLLNRGKIKDGDESVIVKYKVYRSKWFI